MRDFSLFTKEEFERMLRHLKEEAEKYSPELRKKKKTTKEKKVEKKFEGYNWTTHKKTMEGQARRLSKLRAIKNPTETEELRIRQMQGLHEWYKWALDKHEKGWSDKRIHKETLRRRETKKKK